LVLQQFKPSETISNKCSNIEPYSEKEMKQFKELLTPFFGEVNLRLW
jgi:hypothetical protein